MKRRNHHAADLASAAAAVTAGYMKIQYDHGALANPRYETMFEKHQQGIPGYSGGLVRYHGESKHLGCRSRHRSSRSSKRLAEESLRGRCQRKQGPHERRLDDRRQLNAGSKGGIVFDPNRKPRLPSGVEKILEEREKYFDPRIGEDEDGFTLEDAEALGWNVEFFRASKHFPGRGLIEVRSRESDEGR